MEKFKNVPDETVHVPSETKQASYTESPVGRRLFSRKPDTKTYHSGALVFPGTSYLCADCNRQRGKLQAFDAHIGNLKLPKCPVCGGIDWYRL